MTATRLSPLYDALHGAKAYPRAKWGAVSGTSVPLCLDEPTKEADLAKNLALADASFFSRIVVKGPQATLFLQSQNIPIPASILKIAPLEQGGLIARTGGSEFFLEDGVIGNIVASLEKSLGSNGQPGVYPVLRQDAALILSGARAGELFRHVSSYDFLNEPHHDLVFTQVAGLSCSVLRQTINGVPAFRLWTDGTYGLYIWHTLLAIAQELGGGAVGTAVFFPELNSRPRTP